MQGTKWYRCHWCYKNLETTLAVEDKKDHKHYIPLPPDINSGLDDRRVWRAVEHDNGRYHVHACVGCINKCARRCFR